MHKENERKEFWRKWRMRVRSFTVHGECTGSHLTLHLIRQENLSVYGEYAERIYACIENVQRDSAYSPNTSRDTKLSIARLIIVQNKNISRSFFIQDGWVGLSQKTSHTIVPLISLLHPVIRHSFFSY